MRKISLVIVFVLMTGMSQAETVTLNNGKVLEGDVVSRTDDEIRIDTGAGTVVTYFMDEVESVDGKKLTGEAGTEEPKRADKSVPAEAVALRIFGGEGTSQEDALIVPDVANYLLCGIDIACISAEYGKSIGQEYQYLDKTYGIQGRDWDLKEQKLLEEEGKIYDKMIIQDNRKSEEIILYFDITQPMTNFREMLQRAQQ